MLIAISFAAGCESAHVVETLPQPNFNGPNIAAGPMTAPRPLPPVAAIAPTPAPKPQAFAGSVPRDWLPLPGAHRDWYWIVIHHSATPAGSLRDFDREHREKGWDECGYDFVIGNGTNSGNGQVEVGSRWPKQKYGAHAKTPDNRYNEHGIGICLVGNFQYDRPTAAQLQSLTKLVAYLSKTYNIPANRILRHKDTKPTECPGTNLNIAVVRRAVQQQLAGIVPTFEEVADDPVASEPITAAAELLQDASEAPNTATNATSR
jgi:hypothetical protein